MKKTLILVSLSLLCLFFSSLIGSSQESDLKVPKKAATVTAKVVNVHGKKVTDFRQLTFRERRQLGLTFHNVREARQELLDSGEIDENTSPSETSVLILNVIKSKNSTGFAASPDWIALIEAILAFIEQLLAFFN